MQETTVTVMVPQVTRVTNKKVLLQDVVKITGEDKALVKRLQQEVFYQFPKEKAEKKVFTSLKLVEAMERLQKGVTVNVIGEPSFIVEYLPSGTSYGGQWWKVLFVSVAVFFGGAFSIMTFNQDVEVTKVFSLLYELAGFGDKPKLPVMEIGYSLGLAVGIIVFFNHFSHLRLDADPTPLEVQMRTYEKEVNDAIMENASREGKVD
ncbi:MAG: stage V sporulation protein AA [Lachnospiraceae bacterium]|nr:stage V sporulation protein AA [Lachnospiraceae bacterium]